MPDSVGKLRTEVALIIGKMIKPEITLYGSECCFASSENICFTLNQALQIWPDNEGQWTALMWVTVIIWNNLDILLKINMLKVTPQYPFLPSEVMALSFNPSVSSNCKLALQGCEFRLGGSQSSCCCHTIAGVNDGCRNDGCCNQYSKRLSTSWVTH